MPTPEHFNGAPCWIDLMSSDTTKAKQFYGGLFGWTFEAGDQEKYGGYITALKNGKSVAGIMQKQEADRRCHRCGCWHLADRRDERLRARSRSGFAGVA